MKKSLLKQLILTDARDLYPELPGERAMGAVFLNVGLRLAVAVALVIAAKDALFSDRLFWMGTLFWLVVLTLAIVHVGYFIYSFNQYFQAVMQRRHDLYKKRKQDHPADPHDRPAKDASRRKDS